MQKQGVDYHTPEMLTASPKLAGICCLLFINVVDYSCIPEKVYHHSLQSLHRADFQRTKKMSAYGLNYILKNTCTGFTVS